MSKIKKLYMQTDPLAALRHRINDSILAGDSDYQAWADDLDQQSLDDERRFYEENAIDNGEWGA